MERILIVDQLKCDGCGDCVLACEEARRSVASDGLACLKLVTLPDDGLWFPIVCQHCDEPLCALTCPTGALSKNEVTGWVNLDRQRCAGCGMCVVSCPFGAVRFNSETRKPAKCDLCGGDPACVKKCKPGALFFSKPHLHGNKRRTELGAKLSGLIGGHH